MRRTQLRDNPCSIAKALDVVGDPWTMLILRDALLGVTRFDDFATRLGIPRATLTARLDHLCETGVFAKVAYQESPARYDYALTEKGEGLRPVVVTLLQWGDRWARDDEPPTHLVDAENGRRLDPVLVDRTSGVPLDELEVRAVGRVTEGIERRSSAPL
ncbi:MAG: transcriptional regulator [Ilumatobacter sp.]|nr:MAG: transcriptional regulator [Ilumatobacter sp.]